MTDHTAYLSDEDTAEDTAIEELFPWHCYKNYFTTLVQYKSLVEMCSNEGMDKSVVLHAIGENKGNWGAYHFVHRC